MLPAETEFQITNNNNKCIYNVTIMPILRIVIELTIFYKMLVHDSLQHNVMLGSIFSHAVFLFVAGGYNR